jgi:urease accessory protein
LVAAAADLPVGVGAAIIGAFALLHGHAHGTEIPQSAGGLEYAAGFAFATASLHLVGIGAGLTLGTRFRGLVRAGGAACVLIGLGLALGTV